MEYNFLPCCFHPTQVVLVDDDERFLNSLIFTLGNTFILQPFIKPLNGLEYLTQEYKENSFNKRCLLRPEEDSRDHRYIDVDIKAIHDEIYNSDRFNQISVVVVDYAMPGLNGLDFCKQLKGTNYKIILLTGEADESLAINAFNNGLIHHFVRKDTKQFLQQLQVAIIELQYQYFQDLSAIVVNSLTKNPEYPPSCLDDPAFINFFTGIIEKNKIVEFYLIEATGSFLFLDANGIASWLVVKDEDAMKGAAFEAEMSDENVDAEILDALRSKRKLVFHYSSEDMSKNPASWGNYLHSAEAIVGKDTYYFAYIPNSNLYTIQKEKVLSLNRFNAERKKSNK